MGGDPRISVTDPEANTTTFPGTSGDGRLEGTNNKLGVLKRIAYGFVSAANFGHRALLLTPGVAS